MRLLRDDFDKIGEPLPNHIFIRVGYPHYSVSSTWLGECVKKYRGYLIYINPKSDGIEALETLIHELIHVVARFDPSVADCHTGHFAEIEQAIGLDKTGDTLSAGVFSMERLYEITELLGIYPLGLV